MPDCACSERTAEHSDADRGMCQCAASRTSRGFGCRFSAWAVRLCCALSVATWPCRAAPEGISKPRAVQLSAGALAWQATGLGAMRGITIGPIENALHAGHGYGSPFYERMLDEAQRMGANWISLTVFGRVHNLQPSGIDPSFEAPFYENQHAISRAVAQAHQRGLRVLLVPHLWVESGDWRGEINPGSDAAWQRWAAAYGGYVNAWARVAENCSVDMFSLGVELRSWLTTPRATSFSAIIAGVRARFGGLLTYAANWDDVEDTVIFGELDLVGLNAFFPLAEKENPSFAELEHGAQKVAEKLRALAELWRKPILLNEYGYTTRPDPALRPWEWPDRMSQVAVDQRAQADAYRALLRAVIDEPAVAGAFVWRMYADPDDVSQEAEWGFSPRGKAAELELRNAYRAPWAADGLWAAQPAARLFWQPRQRRVGFY